MISPLILGLYWFNPHIKSSFPVISRMDFPTISFLLVPSRCPAPAAQVTTPQHVIGIHLAPWRFRQKSIDLP
jgi:hypothetical protein